MNDNYPDRIVCTRIHFRNHNWFGFKNPETNKWWKSDYSLSRTGRTKHVMVGGWTRNPANLCFETPSEM